MSSLLRPTSGGWMGRRPTSGLDREADSRQRGRHKASPQHDLQVLKLFRLPPTQMIRMEIPLSDSVPIEILQLAPPDNQCKWRKKTSISIKGLCKSFPPQRGLYRRVRWGLTSHICCAPDGRTLIWGNPGKSIYFSSASWLIINCLKVYIYLCVLHLQ